MILMRTMMDFAKREGVFTFRKFVQEIVAVVLAVALAGLSWHSWQQVEGSGASYVAAFLVGGKAPVLKSGLMGKSVQRKVEQVGQILIDAGISSSGMREPGWTARAARACVGSSSVQRSEGWQKGRSPPAAA